jgi:hypothetical protein
MAWILFWIAGLPDYYQQYSMKFMIIFDSVFLAPIWLTVYLSVKNARPGRAINASLWWAFYISFQVKNIRDKKQKKLIDLNKKR